MYNHAPQDYKCPICLGIEGVESEDTYIKPTDVVYEDDLVIAFINSFFVGVNSGHVIVVPNKHFENIYDLPAEYATRIFEAAKKVVLAMKESYRCEGITILQNNEPASSQHAFHYHMHVFPRYSDDNIHQHLHEKRLTTAKERIPFAEKLRPILK